MLKFFVFLFFFSGATLAQIPVTDFTDSQLKFTFLSSEGDIWIDCSHEKQQQPHSWVVSCGQYRFDLHLFLQQYTHASETTLEFHYWATETAVLKESHTQSTWITVDKDTKTKKIIGYLGFTNDAMQLRLQVNLDSIAPVLKTKH